MPKEENKQKLRKVAKGLGLGVLSLFATIGIVATIACLARCGEQPKQEASAQDVSLPYVRNPRKDAPTFDEDANVFTGDNLDIFPHRVIIRQSGNYNITYNAAYSQVDVGQVRTAGLYWLSVGNYSGSVSNRIYAVTGAQYGTLLPLLLDPDGTTPDIGTYWSDTSEPLTRVSGYVYVTEQQAQDGFFVISQLSVDSDAEFRMYAVDMMEASPSDKVTLPEAWKPYELIDCEPKQNGFGVCNKRTAASLSPLGYGVVKGLLFRSNGNYYNKIEVDPWSPYLDNSTAHTFGYYDASGRLVYKALQGDFNDLILYRIRFTLDLADVPHYFGAPPSVVTQEVAYCPETSVIVEQEARVVYLSAGPLTWNSPLFRELDVLDVYDEHVKPTDTLVARNPLEWLRLSLASVNPSAPTTDVGIQDGMTLVSDGLVAFMPILGIEVLPSISLGLLLILPLIGGIIVLIVKVFSK